MTQAQWDEQVRNRARNYTLAQCSLDLRALKRERTRGIPLPKTFRGERIALRALVQRLAAFLAEAHEPDKRDGHRGDDPSTCSYCNAIREANALIRWGNPR